MSGPINSKLQGTTNRRDDEWRGMAVMMNGRDNSMPHPRYKCEMVGHFFCYFFFLFSLSSPTYAAASTCSQGVYALILFNILN
jgi:hypothetical protein